MKATTLTLLLLAASCDRVGWIEDFLPKLRCGMSLGEVRQLTEREVQTTNTMPWLGSYRVDGKRADVWLDFDDGGLVTAISGRIDGLTSVRLSPKENLCTGDLAFRINLVLLSRDLIGAVVYLDGQEVAVMDEVRQDVEVPSGVHALRIELEGFSPFEMELNRVPDDPGMQRLEINAVGDRLAAVMIG